MKHLLLAFFIVAFIPRESFAGEFPSSAKDFMESSVEILRLRSGTAPSDIQEFKNEFTSLISQIDSAESEKAQESLKALLNRSDVTYSEGYKQFQNKERDNSRKFAISIAFQTGKSTFEFASIAAAGVVHFYPMFASSLLSTDINNHLLERLLKLALYNAIQDDERFAFIGNSIQEIMEEAFSDGNYEILDKWEWLKERNWFGNGSGFRNLLNESKYKLNDCPEGYKGRYERFYLWKWASFDLVQRLSFLKTRYSYNKDALTALVNIEVLIGQGNYEQLVSYKNIFNNKFHYALLGSTEDAELAEVVSNAERASEMGIDFRLPFATSSIILGCEAAKGEQPPLLTIPDNK